MQVFIQLLEGDNSQVKLFYPGEFKHGLYGKFSIDPAKMDHGINNFNNGVAARFDEKGGKILPANYQHAGYDKDPEKSKASGWIKRLYRKGAELWAEVEWTEKAKEFIKNKEFRFLSPEYSEDWADENGKRHGFTVLGVALCNYPFLKKGQLSVALNDNDRIVFEQSEGDTDMEKEKELRVVLELKDGEDILDTVKKLKEEKASTKLTDEVKTLTDKNTKLETELKDAKKNTGTKDGFVQLSDDQYKELKEGNERTIELEKKIALKDAEDLVDSFINCKEPKLLTAQRDRSIKMALTDMDGFKEFMGNAKPVMSLVEKGSGADGSTGETGINDLDKEVKLLMSKDKDLNYSDALAMVQEQKPELVKGYTETYKQE